MTPLAQLAVAVGLAFAPPDSTAIRPTGATDSSNQMARPVDPWFAADKVKHFALAGFAESIGFAAAREVGADRRAALSAGLAIGLGVSVAKELADRRRGGRASARDLVWDLAGMAAYAALLARTAR